MNRKRATFGDYLYNPENISDLVTCETSQVGARAYVSARSSTAGAYRSHTLSVRSWSSAGLRSYGTSGIIGTWSTSAIALDVPWHPAEVPSRRAFATLDLQAASRHIKVQNRYRRNCACACVVFSLPGAIYYLCLLTSA
eukprot:3205207-Heterocapsa_arctica.AAC.1